MTFALFATPVLAQETKDTRFGKLAPLPATLPPSIDARPGKVEFYRGLAPSEPAALFRADTLYNITDGTMVETPQLMPSINSLDEAVAKNADGSIDLRFGPAKPADAPATNFIQNASARNFPAAVRLYGTGVEFFDQTWKPDDVVKVK